MKYRSSASFLILLVLLACSCRRESRRLEIVPTPIYSETDSRTGSTGYVQHNLSDYFIVRTNVEDKQEIASAVDSFIHKYAAEKSLKYDNYTVYVYRESSGVNEKELKNYMPDRGYKMFWFHEEDRIADYAYWNGKFAHNHISE